MLADAAELVAHAMSDAVSPDPVITVSDWADQNRVLSAKAANEAGPWRTDRVPFLREIMDCLSDHHPAREIVFMKSTQVGGSEAALNWVGYTIDRAPAAILVVLPTVEVGDRWSKQRLASMVAESPALSRKIAPARSRDSGNTTSVKEFEGGILLVAGANSAASLSSMPIKKLLLEEVDRYPLEVEEEGDPVDLAEARTSTFPRRKIFKVSSPTIESISRINKDWKRSDQRRYYVPCPECREMQALSFDNLRWPDGRPEDARYACEHCGSLIEENRKTWLLAQGEWRATFPERDVVGFHINALYTPAGLGKRWSELAARFDEVKRDPVRLKVFVNTVRGECFEDPNERLDWEELKARAEPQRLRDIPRGYLVLTCGVDVQKDRLELQVWAWGPDERGAVVDYHVIDMDPTKASEWNKLDDYLAQPFRNAFGVDMLVKATAIDAGYLTDDVLNYTRVREGRGVFAIRGHGDQGRAIIGRPSKVDIKRNGVTYPGGAKLWVLGVNAAKHRLFARLAADRKHALPTDRMIRFSQDLPEDYFMQLAAEVFDPNSRRWVKLSNRRNEGLDTAIYAMAAAMHPRLRLHLLRAPQWEQWRSVIEPAGRDLFASPPAGSSDGVRAPDGEQEPKSSVQTSAQPGEEPNGSVRTSAQPVPPRRIFAPLPRRGRFGIKNW